MSTIDKVDIYRTVEETCDRAAQEKLPPHCIAAERVAAIRGK